MKYKVQSYLNILGNLTYFSRTNVTKNTLFYQRGEGCKQALCFYDKEREQRAKHQIQETPQVYKDTANVLRYEARLLKQVPQQLGESSITGAMLDNEELFRKVAKFWGNSYFCIQKMYQSINMEKVKTPNDARDLLLVHLLNEAGADILEKYLVDLKARGVFSNRLYYSRFKSQMKDTIKKYSDQGGESLARELDNDVRTELSYI